MVCLYLDLGSGDYVEVQHLHHPDLSSSSVVVASFHPFEVFKLPYAHCKQQLQNLRTS